MKKILVSMAILGGLAVASPAFAQRENRAPRSEYKHERFGKDRNFEGDRHGRHGERAEGRHRGPDSGRWQEGPRGGKRGHGFRGKGHCRKGAPGRGQRRGRG